MRRVAFAVAAIIAAILSVPTAMTRSNQPRRLTFEDRVRAQEAIERVYYSHQIGATIPFAQAVPREVIEKKVRTYLKQSVALERYWQTPVKAESLRAELMRITGHTRSPARLTELHAALGHDPLLVQECLARQLLGDRLVRRFFSHDARIHDNARRQAESLRERLVTGELGAYDEHPSRHVADVARKDENFIKVRGELPARTGEPGPLTEDSESFSTSVLLDENPEGLRLARFSVSKLSWDDWWRDVENEIDPAVVETVADSDLQLPEPVSAPGQSLICGTDDSWDLSSAQDAIPALRYSHSTVWTGNEMIIWGGIDWSGGRHRDGARYNPLTDTWAQISSANAPSWRHTQVTVWTGSRMIVWGGGSYPLGIVNTGGLYDPISDTWSSTSTAGAPIFDEDHTAVWTGSEMIVWGRVTLNYTWQNTGARYDPDTDTWRPISTLGAPDPRARHTAVWTGTRMIVWGGHYYVHNYPTVLASGGRYDPVGDRWEATSMTGAPAARDYHSAVWTGTEMVIWGGRAVVNWLGEYKKTGGRYDPVTDRWTPMSTDGAPSVRGHHAAVWTGKEMIVSGGSDVRRIGEVNEANASGGRYDPLLNRWKPVSLTNALSPRIEHSAVWTGSLLIVWGGFISQGFKPGARYDPVSNVWTPMVRPDSPEAGVGNTAVWTGNHLIVWGGSGLDHYGVVNSGGRYDPVTDNWSDTSRTNAPTRRVAHSAVWTGRYMIIWGGDSVNNQFFSVPPGGRYDPIADVWLKVSTAGEPEDRRDHTAIWTGSHMVVWGGSNFSREFNNGGRYDPTADTWAPVSTIGAPVPRESHSAVWTGTQMIVYGGGLYQRLNSGGRYDPVTDLWTDTSTVGAPEVRVNPTVVWTGSEMFVWGGHDLPGLMQTGGLYDPVTDTWRSTSLTNAPTGRAGHTAVWTGHVVIVWGGADDDVGGVITNTGGRYDPATDTWTDTSTTGAPSECSSHTAVWTGSSMLVWGGGADIVLRSYLLEQTVDNDGDGASECDGDCNDINPGTVPGMAETCDDLDNDCDGQVDEDGVCDPVITSPLSGQVMNCAPGATPPTITWEPGRFDGFRIYIAWDPAFAATARVTTGDSLVRTNYTWTPSLKQWRKACANASPDLYVRVEGFDSTLPKGDPLKRVMSDTVSVTVQ